MVFLYSIIFLAYNLFIGFLLVFIIKVFLFIPREKLYIGNKKVPFTPGFAFRKKDWLIQKLSSILSDFLRDCRDEKDESMISKWELEVFKKTWDKLESIENIKFVPRAVKEKIHYFCSVLVYEIVKQFLRSFIPYLIENYKVSKYIDVLSQKLDMNIICGYFNKYVFKYMMLFSLAIHFLIGLGNMIVYLIIH